MLSTYSRPDGRAPHQLGPIIAEFDSLARVDSSARFGFGKSPSALASFTGPVEVRLAAENPSRIALDVLVRPLRGVPGVHEKKIGTIIASVLKRCMVMEASPRTAVTLVVQSLSDDESLASMINASSLACMSAASVPMRGVVCAVAMGISNGGLIVDPSPDERSSLSAFGCFAFHIQGSEKSECVWTDWQGGSFDEQELLQARRIAQDSSLVVWAAMKEVVGENQGLSLHTTDDEDKMEI